MSEKIPPRMRNLETAKGFEEFNSQLRYFMGINNFSGYERSLILHALNSFYMLSPDIENHWKKPEIPDE